MIELIDTYSSFLEYWDSYADRSAEEKADGWEREYMSLWPELLRKQKNDYLSMSLDWRKVGLEKVFPFLSERIEVMSRARALLSVMADQVCKAAEEAFEMELDIVCVIYVGVGCGAGWVTDYRGKHAILLGLEMIAETGWTDEESLRGLLAHELGHAIHGILRADPGLRGGKGPFWQLYTEGFAQRCEHLIMQRDTWHVGRSVNEPDWLQWCGDNRIWLVGKFLQAVDMGEDVRPFFGSWYEIEGRRHCGHYLGHDVVLALERTSDLRTVACLENVDEAVTSVLEGMITRG